MFYLKCMKTRMLFLVLVLLAWPAQAQNDLPIPGMSYFDLNGNAQSLNFGDDPETQITLLHFWATWCAPCTRELPSLNALAKRKPKGVRLVTVALDNDPAQVSAFFKRYRIDALTPYIDTYGNSWTRLAISALPTTMVLDNAGIEKKRMTGEYDWGNFTAENPTARRLD